MEALIVFNEIQRAKLQQLTLWFGFMLISLPLIPPLFYQVVTGRKIGNHPLFYGVRGIKNMIEFISSLES